MTAALFGRVGPQGQCPIRGEHDPDLAMVMYRYFADGACYAFAVSATITEVAEAAERAQHLADDLGTIIQYGLLAPLRPLGETIDLVKAGVDPMLRKRNVDWHTLVPHGQR